MLQIRFLGVRGTIAKPGAAFVGYGGNTSCVEVRCGDHLLFFDAGTGITSANLAGKQTVCDILLSHTHIDHIQGFPFFAPVYDANAHIDLWAGNLAPENTLEQVLTQLMQPPLFPIHFNKTKADITCHDFTAGEDLGRHATFSRRGIAIKTMLLNHPDRATGYRLEFEGKSVCYLTDVEYGDAGIPAEVVAFCRNADVLIHDATYATENYAKHKGWGHATWQECAEIATRAQVKQLFCFHHDPDMDDTALLQRETQLKALLPHAALAKEGVLLRL